MADPKARKVPGAILSRRQREQLELEVVSSEARLRLTRLLRKRVRAASSEEAHQIELIRKNAVVNIASNVMGHPIYTLELNDWDYANAEYAWHNGEFELVMRRPDTAQLIEILHDLVDAGWLSDALINSILEADGSGVRFSSDDDETTIELLDIAELPDDDDAAADHPNVRKLVDRMDRALQDKDWSLVLHTGASIFETVAKQVVPNPNVQSQSLGGWFSLYRNHSNLAVPLLDAIEAIFKRRNIEPLAGHGSTSDPSITQEEAIQIRALTVALVRLERTLMEASAS